MSVDGVAPDFPDYQHAVSSQTTIGDFAIRLKLIRETFGLSQRELAKRAGVTNSSISMIELGQVSPSIQSLERILSAIPISLSVFFGFQLDSKVRVAREAKQGDSFLHAGDQLSVRYIEVAVNSSTVPAMLDCDASGVIVTGNAQLKSILAEEPLGAADTFYVPSRQLHQFINSGQVPLKLFICSLFTHSC